MGSSQKWSSGEQRRLKRLILGLNENKSIEVDISSKAQ